MACLAAAVPTVEAADTMDGVYSGKRLLAKGPVPPCVAEMDASATIHGNTLTLTLANGELRNFPINFNPRPDGSFGEIYSDAGGFTVLIHGRLADGAIDADATSSTCMYHWHLKKE
jgi:hypothetical protein